jgi:hypothetical protein
MEECEMNHKQNQRPILEDDSLRYTKHSGKYLSEHNVKESPPSKSKVSTKISQSMIGSKGGKDSCGSVRIVCLIPSLISKIFAKSASYLGNAELK